MESIDNEAFVRYWRKQRHDVLNNLQVIIGFLQIGRPQEALDYSKGVADRLGMMGELLKTADSGFQVALIQILGEAQDLGIELQVVVKGNWGLQEVPGEQLTAAAAQVWRQGRIALGHNGSIEAEAIVTLEAGEKGFTVSLRWSEDWEEGAEADPWLVEEFLPGANRELREAAEELAAESIASYRDGWLELGICCPQKGIE